MTNAHGITSMEPEPVIEALLAHDEQTSIVDGLFALPEGGTADVQDQWSRAVRDRLQARLAARMRSVIEAAEGGAAEDAA